MRTVGALPRWGLRRFGDLTDHQLTERAHHGDRAAYRELARRNRARTYRSVSRMLGSSEDPEVSEDMAQDIAIRPRLALVPFLEANPP